MSAGRAGPLSLTVAARSRLNRHDTMRPFRELNRNYLTN